MQPPSGPACAELDVFAGGSQDGGVRPVEAVGDVFGSFPFEDGEESSRVDQKMKRVVSAHLLEVHLTGQLGWVMLQEFLTREREPTKCTEVR